MSKNKLDLTEVFSEREQLILKVIGKKQNMTIKDITREVFNYSSSANPATTAPIDAEVTIGNSIRRIIRKCQAFKIHWTLSKHKIDGRMVIMKEFI